LSAIPSLLDILDLETIDVDLYRGRSPQTRRQRVFGGQVAGQALVAAGSTVDEDRHVHSLHAYFLRAGDPSAPIVYHVERIRDGRSFTTRRVVATQRSKAIFLLAASFQVDEDGLDHHQAMPEAPDPESLVSLSHDRVEPGSETAYIAAYSAIDVRLVPGPGTAVDVDHPQVWFRVTETLGDRPLAHVCAVAYASDLTLLGAALRRHHVDPAGLVIASLDHAMWFHRAFRADEWWLYDQTSPSASGGRGLAMGHIYTRGGDLVASVVQEGLMRPRTPRPDEPAGRV
jgi:acyl-CoA thioesterase-2